MEWTAYQGRVNILQYYTTPVAAFLGLSLIGFALGGLGYILALKSN